MTAQPRPTVAPPAAWTFPESERFTLPSGLAVQLYHLPGQHVASVGLMLDAPLSEEPRDREGVAGLLAATLDQGTRSHPQLAFADAIERCGAVLEATTVHSGTQIYLDVPESRLGSALPLLVGALTEPQLLDQDVLRERSIALANIEQQLATSAGLADQTLQQVLIDATCRAARLRSGQPDTVANVTPDDVRAFHSAHFGPRGATLVVAGDFSRDVRTLVADAFGGWTNPSQLCSGQQQPRPSQQRLVLVDRPGSVQADVRMARFTIDRSDPRWADLQLGVYALGGAFLSRLNSVLREEKGYTYGVHAATTPLRKGGFTTVSGSFRNDAVADAVASIPGLLDVSARRLTTEEIDRARTYLAGVQPLQYATASGVCNGVMQLVAAGLDATFVDRLRADYSRVTAETATQTVAELLPPDGLSLVVVGDAESLTVPLQERGFDVTVATTPLQ